MASQIPSWYFLISIHVLFFCSLTSTADESDAKVLIEFRGSLLNATALDVWDEKISLCTGNVSNWRGVLCLNGKLTGLRLESMGLMGAIDVNTLSKLQSLRTISFMNNSFTGYIPDMKILKTLRGLYLSNNRFSGEIPGDAFLGMKGMRRIVLANNEFTGRIPESLTTLSKLVDLQLQNNKFDDVIPDFPQMDLVVNFANNRLEGPIPVHLSNHDSSSFFGNINLCGKPLMNPCKTLAENIHHRHHSIPKLTIIFIILAAVSVLTIIATCCLCTTFRSRPSRYQTVEKDLTHHKTHHHHHHHDNSENKKLKYPQHITKSFKNNNNNNNPKVKLYFVKSNRERFELDDLLRAPAEVLGSGSFGSSYKADLLFNNGGSGGGGGGVSMVVRRFRQMSNVGREEFHEHMRRLGRLSHPNLLSLVAFYYRKEEKLLITDYVHNGSLASHLHGKRSPNQPALDWPTRLKVIKGVSRGLSYLYKELPGITIPHGHLKSSNVLLDQSFSPILSDYALVPVINKDHAQQFMVAYKSPEYMQHDRVSRKTDVWSLGILILELLTGKFPANYLKQGKVGNADLATWVNSVVRDEWTGEIFDKEMDGTKNAEGEMVKMLKIGMCCCEWNEEIRWDLKEAIERIEELKEKDYDDYDRSNSYGSEGEFYSSRTSYA